MGRGEQHQVWWSGQKSLRRWALSENMEEGKACALQLAVSTAGTGKA